MIRHQLAVVVRTRAALAPAAAFLFVLLGVYAYRDSGVGPTYAFTALLLCPTAAWLAAAGLPTTWTRSPSSACMS